MSVNARPILPEARLPLAYDGDRWSSPGLSQPIPKRTSRFLDQGLTQDLAMFGFGRTAMLGGPLFQAGDEFLVKVADD